MTEATCIYCDEPILESRVSSGGDSYHELCLNKLNQEMYSSIKCPICKGTKQSLIAKEYSCLKCKGNGTITEEEFEKLKMLQQEITRKLRRAVVE